MLDMLQLLADCVSGSCADPRGHLIVETRVVDETRPADAPRDGQRGPAAAVGDRDVFDIKPFQHCTGGDDRIVTVSMCGQAGVERSWNREGALPFLWSQTDVARRQGKAVS